MRHPAARTRQRCERAPPADARAERALEVRAGRRRIATHRRRASLLGGGLTVLALCGCAGKTDSPPADHPVARSAIERYLSEVEPIRRSVNSLLEGADPVLTAFAERRIGHGEAATRMGALERRFAAYAVAVAAVDPPSAQLRSLNGGYAATYVLEDAYLSALVAGLHDGELDELPSTQAAQRAAIIRWRVELTVLARAARAPLPADLQQAGRGEIAPAPDGS